MADTPITPILPEGEEHEFLPEPTEVPNLGAPEEYPILAKSDEALLIEEGSLIFESNPEPLSVPLQVPLEASIISPTIMAEEIQSVDFDAIEEDDKNELSDIPVISLEVPAVSTPIEEVITASPEPQISQEVLTTLAPVSIPTTISTPTQIPYSGESTQHFEVHTDTVLPSKSHKNLIIGGIAAILVALISAGTWAFFSKGAPLLSDGVSYTVSSESDSPITYEDTIAEKIKQDEADIGFMNQALSSQDGMICLKIQSEEKKAECSESIIAVQFSLSGSLDNCSILTITDIRDRCISTLSQKEALATMNKSLCDTITDTDQSQYCRESIDERILSSLIETKTATPASCNNLESKYREPCLATVVRVDDNGILQDAIQNDDLDACNGLSTEELQFTCFDTILLKRALISKDKNLCDLIRDTKKKASCVSYTSQQDDNTVFKNAIIDKNLPACSQIASEALRNRCNDSVILLIVRDTKDATLCNKLINTETVASCQKTAGIQ